MRCLRVLCVFRDADMGYVRLRDCFVTCQFVDFSEDVALNLRAPASSCLENKLSMMRFFSSSKRSARVMVPCVEFVGGGERLLCGGCGLCGGRTPEAGPLGSPPPRGNRFCPSMVAGLFPVGLLVELSVFLDGP
jgi:hypothetical protein